MNKHLSGTLSKNSRRLLSGFMDAGSWGLAVDIFAWFTGSIGGKDTFHHLDSVKHHKPLIVVSQSLVRVLKSNRPEA